MIVEKDMRRFPRDIDRSQEWKLRFTRKNNVETTKKRIVLDIRESFKNANNANLDSEFRTRGLKEPCRCAAWPSMFSDRVQWHSNRKNRTQDKCKYTCRKQNRKDILFPHKHYNHSENCCLTQTLILIFQLRTYWQQHAWEQKCCLPHLNTFGQHISSCIPLW